LPPPGERDKRDRGLFRKKRLPPVVPLFPSRGTGKENIVTPCKIPSLCPVGRLSPVNGRELKKNLFPALTLPLFTGLNEVPAKRKGGRKADRVCQIRTEINIDKRISW